MRKYVELDDERAVVAMKMEINLTLGTKQGQENKEDLRRAAIAIKSSKKERKMYRKHLMEKLDAIEQRAERMLPEQPTQ